MRSKVNAFHSNWTAPFFALHKGERYFIEDYEILTTILSALKWREHNGGIKMATDETGAAYYRQLGMEHIWDLGIDTSSMGADSALAAIDPFLFWAAGKLIALQQENSPCVMLDTDFIVWDTVGAELSESPLVVAHREYISGWIYPDATGFNTREGYHFPDEWDWSLLPCNTAFLYIADDGLKRLYTDNAIRFMNNVIDGLNNTATMVFAEQRLLAICAGSQGVPVKSLLDIDGLENQNRYTHVWGFKNSLRTDKKEKTDFCIRCVKRILNDFPEEKTMLSKIEAIAPYYNAAIKELL
jgi:hypothetical protein